jgi:toxin-antitoxin system PIN domain toxin
MRSLLDVNVLIALLDADHSLHEQATDWLRADAREGWASCALTQNGCLRVMSTAAYRHPLPVQAVAARLAEACATPLHEFWACDLSVLDPRLVDISRVHGPKQLTDVYLLALAVRHGGRLVTFDGSIARNSVVGAGPRHLFAL